MVATTPSPVDRLTSALAEAQDEQSWLRRVSEFGAHVVRPAGELADRAAHEEFASRWSPLPALIAQARREGFTRFAHSADPDPRRHALLLEELAAADAGVAALLYASAVPFHWAAEAGGEPATALGGPYLSGSHSDWIGCAAPEIGGVRATATPGGWLLSGVTAPTVGGALGTHALVTCTRVGPSSPPALVLVALDRPGVRREPVATSRGLRALCSARLLFDEVRVAVGDVLGRAHPTRLAAELDAAWALLLVGVGRAAYEGTLRWAREGTWAGDPRAEGTEARSALFRQFTTLERSRELAHDAYRRGARDVAAVARATAREAALEAAATAIRLCDPPIGEPVVFLDGSAFHPYKLLRDAQTAIPGQPRRSAAWAL